MSTRKARRLSSLYTFALDPRKEARADGRKDGMTEGMTEGQKDRRTDGSTVGRTEGRMNRRKDGRTDLSYDSRRVTFSRHLVSSCVLLRVPLLLFLHYGGTSLVYAESGECCLPSSKLSRPRVHYDRGPDKVSRPRVHYDQLERRPVTEDNSSADRTWSKQGRAWRLHGKLDGAMAMGAQSPRLAVASAEQ